MHVLGCKLSLVRLCDSDFGISLIDDITIGITNLIRQFLVLVLLVGYCFGEIMSIKKLFFVFFFFFFFLLLLLYAPSWSKSTVTN